MPSTDAWHVTRTLRALELVAMGPASAAEVADQLQIHVRTARRLLNRLVAEEYLTRTTDHRRRYVATTRIVALAGQVMERTELVQAARPMVSRLRDETGGTAHVSVPSLLAVMCVLHDSGHDPRAIPSLGERIPCHATAAGKALLAFRPRWRDHVLREPLEAYTAGTLVEPVALEAEARRIAARGYAIEDREYRMTDRAVAAPVFSHTGEAVAALGISDAAARMPARRCAELGVAVARVAAGLSEALGHDGSAATPESRMVIHG